MIRYVCNRMLLAMQRRYDYDVSYLQEILQADLRAFLKFMAFQTMASHRRNLPVEALFAAKLRAIIWDDCGPCTQLVVNMALEAEVEPDLVRAIVDGKVKLVKEDAIRQALLGTNKLGVSFLGQFFSQCLNVLAEYGD